MSNVISILNKNLEEENLHPNLDGSHDIEEVARRINCSGVFAPLLAAEYAAELKDELDISKDDIIYSLDTLHEYGADFDKIDAMCIAESIINGEFNR